MSSSNLQLHFSKLGRAELVQVAFTSTASGSTNRSVRGKSAGAFRGAGTFQWTSAVRGLCALAIRTKLNAIDSKVVPRIEGSFNSLASSLDYAISKGPSWLSEMFGFTASGAIVAKRLFSRSNPNLKRMGPVVVAINQLLLQASDIEVIVDGKVIADAARLFALLGEIEIICVDDSATDLESVELRRAVNG